ncbi:MAG: hypothetical protein LQ351_007426 [Letrouitia transgressa]|nr:MAG: hypothetical protein LQ351_007426 [Letrouitia transgressa]
MATFGEPAKTISDGKYEPGSPIPTPKTSYTAAGPITLQVGEQKFFATHDTLSGSAYLKSISSGRWEESQQADGSYFIDMDSDVFKYILRFLRHGIYPLCYDNVRGHDYAMYENIRSAAEYLVVEKLVHWLSEKNYIDAVTTKYQLQIDEGLPSTTSRSNAVVKFHHTYKTKKCYVCPRRITRHYDNPGGCGRDCRRAQGDEDPQYEDVQVWSILMVTETVQVDSSLLREQ